MSQTDCALAAGLCFGLARGKRFDLNDEDQRILEAAGKALRAAAETLFEPRLPAAQRTAQKLTYTVEEAAKQLSCKPGLIRKLIRQRRLPRLADVRKIIIPADSLDNFVKDSTAGRA